MRHSQVTPHYMSHPPALIITIDMSVSVAHIHLTFLGHIVLHIELATYLVRIPVLLHRQNWVLVEIWPIVIVTLCLSPKGQLSKQQGNIIFQTSFPNLLLSKWEPTRIGLLKLCIVGELFGVDD